MPQIIHVKFANETNHLAYCGTPIQGATIVLTGNYSKDEMQEIIKNTTVPINYEICEACVTKIYDN